ncbi:hypothetical protein M8J75_014222 [Diaphorina citri]|nr:hypothetical protein M8J75_014222 [Diaphorina citri]
MENHEKSNPILKILKHTKFGITDSIVQGTNLLTYSSHLGSFIQSLKDIGVDNCVLPEKLVKYKVCKQNNFRPKNENIFDDVLLRPISSGDIECLEREIQDTDRVLMEKRKVLQSLRSDTSHIQDKVIPKAEAELKCHTRKIEIDLANFIELNVQLNTQYNVLNQSKHKLLEILTPESNEGNRGDSMYFTYDFESALFHLLQRMNTDFNVLCKYVNSTSHLDCNDGRLEFDIELLGNSLSALRSKLETTKAINHANEKREEKLHTIKRQLEKGSFKFNRLESSGIKHTSSQQLGIELRTAWSKVEAKHSAQIHRTTGPALRQFYHIQTLSLDSRITLLHGLSSGVSCVLSFKLLLSLLVELERDKYTTLFELLYETHGKFDTLYNALMKQETKLKQIMSEDLRGRGSELVHTAQSYAIQLIGQQIRLEDNISLDEAMGKLEHKVQCEKERIQQEYSVEAVYRKLAPLRQRIKDKQLDIYSGPTQVPMFPYRQHNEAVISRNLQLSKLKVEYENLLRDIRSRNSEVTNPIISIQSKHQSMQSDSGIESHNFSV